MNEISNRLDSRADYIKQLTQSLSGKTTPTNMATPTFDSPAPQTNSVPPLMPQVNSMHPPPLTLPTPMVIDDNSSYGGSMGDESTAQTSVLFKYGREASTTAPTTGLRKSSDGIAGRKSKTRPQLSSAQSLDSIDNFSDLKSDSLARDSLNEPHTGSLDGMEEAHLQFLVNKEQNRGRSQKLVSGSQFRNTTKVLPRCEMCAVGERVNRKNKETIRSLRLQIARLEEQNHDLRRSKSSEIAQHMTLKSKEELDEEELEGIEYLAKQIENKEEEVAKLKKMLTYERSLNEGMRKTLDETRTGLKEELAACQAENVTLKATCESEIEKRQTMERSLNETTSTLMQYKQQLERSENKLSDAMLQLNAAKNLTTSIDHLKEIERLKGALKQAEVGNKNLLAQLTSRENELMRTKERLEVVELTISGLEDAKAAAQTQAQRTLSEMREIQELMANTKKRCDILEDTLNATIKEKEKVIRLQASTEASLKQSNQQVEELQGEVRQLNAKVQDLLRRMTKESENTKRALEKAITASVRLCVVAPTVNVHVADKKLKFKSGLKQDALKNFLSSEVLEKYNFLFKQKTENSAPNGTNLEPWLQSMLGQMQTSIENHVNSAMDGSAL